MTEATDSMFIVGFILVIGVIAFVIFSMWRVLTWGKSKNDKKADEIK